MPDDLGPTAIYGWLSLPSPKPGSGKQLAGAAFLLSSDLALTCAHVIRDHLDLKETPLAAPRSPVVVRFEALDLDAKATVIPEGWYPDSLGGPAGRLRDVAFLRLTPPIDTKGLRYLALAPWVPRGGKQALVKGAEPGYESGGQNVDVALAGNSNNRGLWQLDARRTTGFRVELGFSGAPLLDEAETVLWGMVVEIDAKGRGVAFAVGADRLYEARRNLPQEVSVAVPGPGHHLPELGVPEEMRKLQEQLSRANTERDAARRELEVLRKRLGIAL